MGSFEEYVDARGAALLRFAYLLCGDAHRAEDLVQEALIRCHRRWSRIAREAPDAYVRKAILRQYQSWRRRRSSTEVPAETVRDGAAADSIDPGDSVDSVGERDALRHLLARLPRRQRAVLVLRYYEDLPDAEIAELLGCATATVRRHAANGLARLRGDSELWSSWSSRSKEHA